MSVGLNINSKGEFDFISLGALVHRIDPGTVPFRKAVKCSIHVSGGEFNVAANLADCFLLNTGVVSAIVDYPIGDLIAERVRGMGVKGFYKKFKHNGVNGPNMATVYSDRGFGIRAPIVFYKRSNEAAALLKPAMKAAKAAGAVTSFDLNFRAKLWNIWGGEKKAVEVIDRIVNHVDVLVGNEEDLQKGLGIPGPEVASKSKLDPTTFFSMIDKVIAKYPHVKVVATTLREVHATHHHSWSAVAWINGKTYSAPTADLNVFDRVGGGDGFASGFFYGLINNESPEEAVKLGWAHGALLTTYPGDTTMATIGEVRAFAQGGSARIQR